jgi:hypothetical protein
VAVIPCCKEPTVDVPSCYTCSYSSDDKMEEGQSWLHVEPRSVSADVEWSACEQYEEEMT